MCIADISQEVSAELDRYVSFISEMDGVTLQREIKNRGVLVYG